MKKIVLLLFPFILCGCFDFHELDQLAIVNTIAIDYIEEEYFLTLEIIDDQKDKEDEGSSEKVYYISSSGKTIAEAFYNAEVKINKHPFYHHVELLMINKEMVEKKFSTMIDFILRNPNIANSIYLVESKDNLAGEIIKEKGKNTKIGSKIVKGLINNKMNNNALKDNYFQKLANLYLNYGIDTYIPCLSYQNNDFLFKELAIFSNNKVTYINSDEIKLFNILNNNIHNIDYYNDYSNIRIYDGKLKIDLDKDNRIVKIKGDLKAYLSEYNKDAILTDKDAITNINKDYNKILEKDLTHFMLFIQAINSDLLGINRTFYRETRKKEDFYSKAQFDISINLNIEKIGLIFEVKK